MSKIDKDKLLLEINSGITEYHSLSDELRSDRELALAALKFNAGNIKYVMGDLPSDKELVLLSLVSSESAIGIMDNKFFDDEEVMLAATKIYPGYIDLASLRIYGLCVKKDPVEVLTKIVGYNNLNDEIKNTKNIGKKIKI